MSVSFVALLRALGALLCAVLSPPSCAACDGRVKRGRVFCPTCARAVIRAADANDGALAFASFGGAIADALRRFKYEERPDLAAPLGDLVRCVLRDVGATAEVVVPVPLHPKRLAERGYNQAALLARAAARELDAALLPRALVRVRDTPQQARLGRTERLANVERAFVVRDPSAVRGLDVLLVDDVATTGATLSSCRDALLSAGAKSVTTVCLARAVD